VRSSEEGRITVKVILIACVVAALAVPTLGLAARDTAHSYLVMGNIVGGFKTKIDGYPRARQLFGGPYSSTQDHFVCIIRWADGLTITFKRKQPFSVFAKACLVVQSAKITGRRWHTDKGLRIGSSASQITKLYPRAAQKTVGGLKLWVLVPGANPALAAQVKSGKVQYLTIVRT
jgi:hypothetical protein